MSRRLPFQSKFNRFWSQFDLFWLKDQFNDRKSQFKDWKSWLKDQNSQFILKKLIYKEKVDRIWSILIFLHINWILRSIYGPNSNRIIATKKQSLDSGWLDRIILQGCQPLKKGLKINIFFLFRSFPVWSRVLNSFSHLLLVMNSSMNIIFYGVFNQQFRVTAKKLFIKNLDLCKRSTKTLGQRNNGALGQRNNGARSNLNFQNNRSSIGGRNFAANKTPVSETAVWIR